MKNIDEKLTEALTRTSPNPFIVIDLEKKEFVFSTDRFEKALGYSIQELNKLAKDDFIDVFHPEDYIQFQKTQERIQKSVEGEIIKSVVRFKHSNGEYRHFQLYDRVLERNKEGKPTKITSILQDITNEVKASEHLKKTVEKIEKIRFKNSNDLQTPIASIFRILDLIDNKNFQNKYHEDLFKHLIKTVQKLDDIIKQINEEALLPK